jgi:hypothetical protein
VRGDIGLKGNGGQVTVRRMSVYGVMTAVMLVATAAWSGVAAAQVSHHRWPVEYRVVSKSYDHAARLRAWHRDLGFTRAHASIVGGSQVAIAEAPWQAEIYAKYENGDVTSCGGVIFESSEIITAAHCTFDLEDGQRLAPSAFVVVAGIGRVTAEEIKDNPDAQARFVSEVRVHPMFEYARGPGAPDDVAVLELKEPLAFGTNIRAIKLIPGVLASFLSEATKAELTGFGPQQAGSEPDGFLNLLEVTLEFSGRCGGEADALFLCASSPTGSGCGGDVGSALTSGGMLLGMLDLVEDISGKQCQSGATNAFVNLVAGEIRGFIEGSETPPAAPRGGDASVHAVPQVGQVITCEPGTWAGSPEFTYSFVDSANGQRLQSGSSAGYQLTAVDVGRTIYCEVSAKNLGGTGVVRTAVLPAVTLPLTPSEIPVSHLQTSLSPSIVSLVGTNLPVQRNGAVTVKLDCGGGEPCSGRLALQVEQAVKTRKGKKTSRVITVGHATFSIPAGKVASVTFDLDAQGRALLKEVRGVLAARLQLAPTSDKGEIRSVRLLERASHGPTKGKE